MNLGFTPNKPTHYLLDYSILMVQPEAIERDMDIEQQPIKGAANLRLDHKFYFICFNWGVLQIQRNSRSIYFKYINVSEFISPLNITAESVLGSLHCRTFHA